MSVPEERSPIIIEDDALRDGFTQIPNAVLCNPDIGPGAKVAYAVLLSYAWKDDFCYPGQARMAADMGGGERSVRRYMAELAEHGLIEVRHRGLGKTNLYIVKKVRAAKMADDLDTTRRNAAKMAEPNRPKSAPLDRPDWPGKNTQPEEDPTKKMQSDTAASGGARLARPSPTPPAVFDFPRMERDPAEISALLRAGLKGGK
jgi:hypothetical protein